MTNSNDRLLQQLLISQIKGQMVAKSGSKSNSSSFEIGCCRCHLFLLVFNKIQKQLL